MLVALIIALNLSVVSYARFDIDGIQNNDEWSGSELYIVSEDTGLNNDIDFAYIRAAADDRADMVYICVSMLFNHIEPPDLCSVVFKINNGPEIILHTDGSVEADSQRYNVLCASSFDSGSKTIVTEASAAVKEGFGGEVLLAVYLVDTRGIASNNFILTLNKDSSAETTTLTVKSKAGGTVSGTTSKQKSTKTTDAFAYKRVYGSAEDNETAAQTAKADDTSAVQSQAESENLTPDVPDRSVQRKKLITAVGVICAAAVVISAVTAEIIKLRKREQNSQK